MKRILSGYYPNLILYPVMYCILLLSAGCTKQDNFLNTKPNETLAVPATLDDLQKLLNNEDVFNRNDPALGTISSDEYYVTSDVWATLGTPQERNGYTWSKGIYDVSLPNIGDWNAPYLQVYYANTVLNALPGILISSSQQMQFNHIKGSALFFRAIAFYNLVQTFALPYDSATASNTLGIPLKLTADLNEKAARANEKDCYNQVITDLKTSLTLLQEKSNYLTQPNQTTANALLARVYLAMADYNNALTYANACLSLNNQLVDYNTLIPDDYTISNNYLAEDIFHSILNSYGILLTNYESVTDSTLYNSYNENDLRKTCFFVLSGGLPYFRGSYDPKTYTYSGIATDEIYLTRAECNARLGHVTLAMNDLNTLLMTRWKTGTFVPYQAANADDALQQILTERKKELLFRGTRWADLRRLNKDSKFAMTLTRIINGVTYTLPPNDPRYAMPIPDNEISLSGITQNIR